MPSSPYRQKSRRYDRHQSHSKSSDRNYGNDNRKKIHKDRDYDYKKQYNHHKNQQTSKYQYPTRDRGYQKKSSNGQPITNTGKYQANPKIQTIQVKFTQPPSDVKVHFRFKPLKINQKNEDQLLNCVKQHFSSNIGPVQYFSRSYDSRPGNLIIQLGFKYDHDAMLYLTGKKDKFEVKLNGQQLDMIAEPTNAFKMLIPEMEVKKKKQNVHVKQKSPPHQIQSRKRSASKQKKQRRNNNKSSSSSHSGSSSSSSRSKSSRRSKHRHSNQKQRSSKYNHEKDRNYEKDSNKYPSKYNDYEKQRSRDKSRVNTYDKQERGRYTKTSGHGYPQQTQYNKYDNNKYDSYNKDEKYHNKNDYHNKNYQQTQKEQNQIDNDPNLKTLFFFGVHYSVNSKDMTQLFYNHKQGPFYSKKFIWRRMNNSISEFLQGRFQISQANKLLELGDKMQVKGHPFIIIEGTPQATNQYILQKLSMFQVEIQFPRFVEPYYMLKSLIECGRLIQIVSNNKLNEEGRSDFYNVTFNSQSICDGLKQVKKTSKGIIVGQVNDENVMLVYRPNSHTQLMESRYNQNQDKKQAINNDRDDKDDNKSQASRSYSRKSQF